MPGTAPLHATAFAQRGPRFRRRPRFRIRAHRPVATELSVDVVSGDGLPVAWLDLDLEYRYRRAHPTVTRARTDGDGRATVSSRHPELPSCVRVWAAGQVAEFSLTEPGGGLVLEL